MMKGKRKSCESEYHSVEESDSSEDEVCPRNSVGEVPLAWYKDEGHIGYDVGGRKLTRKQRQDKLQSFLAATDHPNSWLKVYDEYNDEDVEITEEEKKMLSRLLDGKAPHSGFDSCPSALDWFEWEDAKHPLSNAPEPKRRFVPSKWELQKVVKYIRAIRKGLLSPVQPNKKDQITCYLLWKEEEEEEDDHRQVQRTRLLSNIPPSKLKIPGHQESPNPPLEYIPTQEEIDMFQLMDEEDRPEFIPSRFTSWRSIPAYPKFFKECFERCLDLYLCPRVRKNRINIDPQSLKVELPNPTDLQPYPSRCYVEYRGHKAAVLSVSVDASGHWLASGSSDGTVRIWEVESTRCCRVWNFEKAVQCVSWNPLPDRPILAISVGQDVLLLENRLEHGEAQEKLLTTVGTPSSSDYLSWLQDDKYGGIRLEHFKTVSSVQWHPKGNYFCTLMPSGQSRAVLIHKLSQKRTTTLKGKLRGLPVSTVFHPSGTFIFVATKKNVRMYDLKMGKLIRKLQTGFREVSSIAIHPAGNNVIVGSKEGKLCWFDMNISSRPYRILRDCGKDITNVEFHQSYPLFVSCSEDNTAYVFHGMVYSDLNQNPRIVPLKILRGHNSSNGRGGIRDCIFHPRQPWLFTAGADSVIELYSDYTMNGASNVESA